tara:strand:+ start:375 stop:539 length:165 start_codon:yes stop_codon:yes gene_type:complete
MNDPIQDRTVILIILSTILLIFIIVFLVIPKDTEFNEPIQWKNDITFRESKINA